MDLRSILVILAVALCLVVFAWGHGNEMDQVQLLFGHRRLSLQTFPPTKSATEAPTKQPTLAPTRQPTQSPQTSVPTGSPVAGLPGTLPPVAPTGGFNNTAANENDARAIAALVGSTVPFIGLGGIALTVYMLRKRRRTNSFGKNQFPLSSNPMFSQQPQSPTSERKPTFSYPFKPVVVNQQQAQVPVQQQPPAMLVQESTQDLQFPEHSSVIPPSIMGIGTTKDSLSNNHKTPRSILSMVLKSREAAITSYPPMDSAEKESGMTKEQIEEKIRRQAVAAARGYSTSIPQWGGSESSLKSGLRGSDA